MKIIYIGSTSPLSLIPLQTLIDSKHEICALAFDELNSNFNVVIPNTIQSLALKNSIPFIKFDKDFTNILTQLRTYQPDVILVSCYARKLPQSILSVAKKGSFNIHPSLLPGYRGPVPLFWQFRDGVSGFGITVHRMDEEFDTGNIVSQKAVEMQDGVTLNQAADILAHTASNLIFGMLNNIKNNSIVETPQNNRIASYKSFPVPGDYTVSTLWTAKRIYNFINAYKGSDVLFLCEIDGRAINLIDAYSYQEIAYEGMDNNAFVQEEDEITFACQDSYIHCRIKIDI